MEMNSMIPTRIALSEEEWKRFKEIMELDTSPEPPINEHLKKAYKRLEEQNKEQK